MAGLPQDIQKGFRRLRKTARTQAAVIACMTSLMELLMANNDDLNAALDKTEQAVVDDETQDDLDISERDATIADLNAQIEALKAGQDTQPIIDRLSAITAKLHKGGATA